MSTETTFWVRYTRDNNDMWLAEVFRDPEFEQRLGVATHGRTLTSTESNVREALALWFDVDDEQRFTLVPRYPDDIVQAAVEVNEKRDAARRAEQDALATTADVARRLASQGLSLRDVGVLLGMSHQRVQQLLTTPIDPVDAPVEPSATTSNPFESLKLSDDSLIGALTLLIVLGFVAWEHNKRKAPRLVVKTQAKPLPAFAEPTTARVYDFARGWARRHGGSVEIPSAIAMAVEQRRRAM